jgi:hypothetical protein
MSIKTYLITVHSRKLVFYFTLWKVCSGFPFLGEFSIRTILGNLKPCSCHGGKNYGRRSRKEKTVRNCCLNKKHQLHKLLKMKLSPLLGMAFMREVVA